jgi:hypothetical protein
MHVHHHEVRHPSVPNHAAYIPWGAHCDDGEKHKPSKLSTTKKPRAIGPAGRTSACRITEEADVSPRTLLPCRIRQRRRDLSLARQKRLAACGGKTIGPVFRRELRNKMRRTESILGRQPRHCSLHTVNIFLYFNEKRVRRAFLLFRKINNKESFFIDSSLPSFPAACEVCSVTSSLLPHFSRSHIERAPRGTLSCVRGYECVLGRRLFFFLLAFRGEKEDKAAKMAGPAASWRLNVSDFQMPDRPKEPPFATRVFLRGHSTCIHPCSFLYLPVVQFTRLFAIDSLPLETVALSLSCVA